MSLLVVENGGLSFADRVLFSELSLRVAEDDRIGLVGPNGSGKTTLLRALSGQQALDLGSLQVSRGVRIGYLPQDIEVSGGRSLRDFVVGGVPGRANLDVELEEAEAELEGAGDDEEMLMTIAGRIADLHERIDHFEQFFSEHEALTILAGLGFRTRDSDRDLAEFSGGWKMRAVLAALLFQRPDVLLLDEPTNHLDMPSVAWFSDFLRAYQRAFVLISHDREFLNEQISRVVSFEPEGVRQYAGNYEQYKRQRAEEEVILENKAKNLERERERMQRFVDRFRAQANKAAAVQSRVKALDKMEDVELYQQRRVMRFTFPPVAEPVSEVIRVEKLGKRYGETEVFHDLDLVVRRGQKIGIIGANGAGKTTLLRILAGEIEATSGSYRLGNKVAAGYYAQHHANTLHAGSTVYEEVARANPEASPARVRNILGGLLFSGDDVDKKVSVLSGGERARVALARLLTAPGNLLLMDEPTNHLDLDSAERLADGLSSYSGTLLFVSHNRSLIRALATTIWNLEDGHLEVYGGSLDEYLYSCRLRHKALLESRGGSSETAAPAEKAPAASAAPASAAPAGAGKAARGDDRTRKRREAEARKKRTRRLGPLEKNVASLEERITALETEQAERSAALADPTVYGDSQRQNALLGAFQDGDSKLRELTGRWEAALAELETARAAAEDA